MRTRQGVHCLSAYISSYFGIIIYVALLTQGFGQVEFPLQLNALGNSFFSELGQGLMDYRRGLLDILQN